MMDNTERLRQANRDIETEIGKLMLSLHAGTKVLRQGNGWQISRRGDEVNMPSLLDALRTFKGLNG